MRLAFDIETNGLLPDVDKLHSLVLKDLDTNSVWSASSQDQHDLKLAVKELAAADYKTGHNILTYDAPVIRHLIPGVEFRGVMRDTLILAKMIWPVDRLKDLDFPRWRAGKLPGQLIGAHRLEAWGYRLGRMKGEYSADVKELSKEYQKHGDITQLPEWARVLVTVDDKGRPALDPWLAWNQPMQDYCVQDVEVTHELHTLIEGHLQGTTKAALGVGWSERSVELEHKVWLHVNKQEERGYGFDREAAVELAGELKSRQRELEAKLVEAFGSWWQPLDDKTHGTKPARNYSEKMTQFPDITVERISEKTGKALKPYIGPPLAHYSTDAPFVRITRTTFNPKSRQHLGERLQEVFGWTPTEFGGKNNDQAKVDETTIRNIDPKVLPDELRQTILEFLVISKTLGQLADGKKAWIDLCREDGRIHGRMDPLGTVSHRGAHMDPNLGQVPSVTKEKVESPTGRIVNSEPEMQWIEVPVPGWKGGFGLEARALFGPGRPFKWQTGVDCSGLELRLLGHYLHPYDGGVFAERVSTPGLDIHAENAKITGLSRGDTKTVTYAFLYGAGALKIGLGVGVPEDQIEELAHSAAAKAYVGWLRKAMKAKFIMPDDYTLAHVMRGQQVKKAFMDGITGLKDLGKELQEQASKQGFIVALDGRKLSIRKAHATLNQALQGGGAIVCKEWMLETDRILREHYALVTDQDYGQMAWVHDELQFEHREEAHGQIIQEASKLAIANVAASLDFRGKLDTDGRTGHNWRDCH
jgi:DNA polymerase I-like protein with 3'-5' exonuclease and polymerase domains